MRATISDLLVKEVALAQFTEAGKFYVWGITRIKESDLGKSWAANRKENITVNFVDPGGFATEQDALLWCNANGLKVRDKHELLKEHDMRVYGFTEEEYAKYLEEWQAS